MTFLLCRASHDNSWGIVNTTCTYFIGSNSRLRPASHLSRALVWHFGQCLERHELKEVASLPHWRQRSRWPPSAAVRQCSMANSTRRCSHVSQERFLSTKLLPCFRMISATSKGGFVIFCAAFATVSPDQRSTVLRYRAAC